MKEICDDDKLHHHIFRGILKQFYYLHIIFFPFFKKDNLAPLNESFYSVNVNQSDAQTRQIHIKVLGATQAQISKQWKQQKPEIKDRKHMTLLQCLHQFMFNTAV